MVQCYYKSGNPALTKPAPCNLTAVAEGKHTSCCAPDELCMSNGLCRNATSTPRTNFYWRGGCTDPTFQDPACPNYCNIKNSWEDQLVWQCSSGDDWCCNNGGAAPEEQRYDRTNLTCCTIAQYTFSAASPSLIATATYLGDVFTVSGTASSTSRSSATASIVASSSSSSSSSAPSTSTNPSPQSSTPAADTPSRPPSSSTSPAAIGAGVGVGVAAGLALCAFAFWAWRRKKGKSSRAGVETRPMPPAELMAAEYRPEAPVVEKYRAELMSDAEPHELAADGWQQGRRV